MRRILSSILSFVFLLLAPGLMPAPMHAAYTSSLPTCGNDNISTKNVPFDKWSTDTKIADVNEININFSKIYSTADGTKIHAWLLNNIDNAAPDQWEISKVANTFTTDSGAKATNNSISFKPFDPQGQLFTEGKHIIRLTSGAFSNQGGICEISYAIIKNGNLRCYIDATGAEGGTGPDQTKIYGLGETLNIAGTFEYIDGSRPKDGTDIDIRLFSPTNKLYPDSNNGNNQDDEKTDGLGNFKGTRTIPTGIPLTEFGTWYITASTNDGRDSFDQQNCNRAVYISDKRGEPLPKGTQLTGSQTGTPSAIATEAPTKAPPPPPCKVPDANGKCLTVSTAIGDIDTDAPAFISSVLKFLLGVSGGIAVMLIIAASYKLMTSQGEAEKVKEARESLTSAIVGLLFIIFSLVILQIIGADILKIPAFISK